MTQIIHADLAAALTAYITDLRERAVAAKKASARAAADVVLHLYGNDGTASIVIGDHRCGDYNTPLAVAMAAAEAWLLRDDLADLNRTLGLSPDGRLDCAIPPAPRAPDPRPFETGPGGLWRDEAGNWREAGDGIRGGGA